MKECEITDGYVGDPSGISRKRRFTDGYVEIAGGIALERTSAVRNVVAAFRVAKECSRTVGSVVVAASVEQKRCSTGGRVVVCGVEIKRSSTNSGIETSARSTKERIPEYSSTREGRQSAAGRAETACATGVR